MEVWRSCAKFAQRYSFAVSSCSDYGGKAGWVQLSLNFASSVCLTYYRLRHYCTEQETHAYRISHGLVLQPYEFVLNCKYADPQVKVAPSSPERQGFLSLARGKSTLERSTHSALHLPSNIIPIPSHHRRPVRRHYCHSHSFRAWCENPFVSIFPSLSHTPPSLAPLCQPAHPNRSEPLS